MVGGSFSQVERRRHRHGARSCMPKLAPGKKAAVVVTGTGAADAPWLFYLNGKACTSG